MGETLCSSNITQIASGALLLSKATSAVMSNVTFLGNNATSTVGVGAVYSQTDNMANLSNRTFQETSHRGAAAVL